MGYDDPYRDEDGEPLMDPDEVIPSGDEEGGEIEPEEDFEEDDWRRERSPTPVHDWDALKTGKPRKRLVKKSDKESASAPPVGFDDEEEDPQEEEQPDFLRDEFEDDGGGRSSSTLLKRKSASSKDGGSASGRKEKKKHKSDYKSGGKGGSRSGKGSSSRRSNDPEMKEMWDTVAGGDSEDDKDPTRTLEDDNFIDDTGVDPADRYGSDSELGFNRNAPQAEEGEEDDEIDALFKSGKKKKKNEKSAGDIAIIVEQLMAELEVTAEEDAELNRHNKPAVNKLKKLPLLTQVLSKKQLQLEFLDHGVLGVLRTWLEPLPDGSLPNISIRTAILKILTDYPIDLEQYDRRDQLKKSNLGKVIMFLSKLDEETTSNRKLAKDLVDKWSRPIFNKSTRFEDMRSADEERVLYRRPASKKPANKASGMESRDDDFDIGQSSQGRKSVQPSSRQHASRPEALPMDFVVRPQSKIDPDEVRARARQIVQDQRRLKMNKKLQQLKAPKKKQLQATKLSVEGRGMVKFF